MARSEKESGTAPRSAGSTVPLVLAGFTSKSAISAYVSSSERQFIPNRRVVVSLNWLATVPYMTSIARDMSTRCYSAARGMRKRGCLNVQAS